MNHLAMLHAAATAARWHAKQRRKGAAAEPYVNHLIEVADLVARAGGSEEEIVAAFLHDAIEDQKIRPNAIAEEFSGDVALLVMEVTDDKKLPSEVRKAEQIRTAPHKSPEAKLIKLADKIANVRSVTMSPPEGWPPERCQDYVLWCGAVVAELGAVSPFLEEEFEIAVENFQASTSAQPRTLKQASLR